MSDLSPEAERLVELTRESFSPDEQAVVALREALEQKLGAASASRQATSDSAAIGGVTRTGGRTIKLWGGLFVIVSLCLVAARFVLPERVSAPKAVLDPVAVRVPERSPELPQSAAAIAPSHDPPVGAESSGTPSTAARNMSPPHQRPQRAVRAAESVAPRAPVSPTPAVQPSAAEDTRADPATVDDTLAKEIAVLRAARAALDRRTPHAALSLLDRHDKQYPRGVLRQERLATRILGLCALGRGEEARTTASQLVRMAPRAPYLAHLRASCVGQIVK